MVQRLLFTWNIAEWFWITNYLKLANLQIAEERKRTLGSFQRILFSVSFHPPLPWSAETFHICHLVRKSRVFRMLYTFQNTGNAVSCETRTYGWENHSCRKRHSNSNIFMKKTDLPKSWYARQQGKFYCDLYIL